jgi:tetratricopeptide (TPR) repeat protein
MEKIRKGVMTPEYQLLFAYAQIQQKKFDAAKVSINTLADAHRGDALAPAIQELNAELYEAMGQFDTAAFIYKQLVNEDPSRARAHWSLARYYLTKGDIPRAVSHLEQTAKHWPKHLGSRYNMAVLKIQEGSLQEAGKWLAECYRINRADAGVLEQLGLLFEKKGSLPEAVRYWQKAVAVSKDAPIAKEKLARYTIQSLDGLMDSNQFDKALAQITSYGKTVEKDPQLLFRRGVIYRNLAQYEKAVRDLKALRKLAGENGPASRELGICYANQKLLDPAGASFRKAVELEPQNGLNYAWLAFILESKGKLVESRDTWKRAIQYLTQPDEIERARRRLASLEKRVPGSKKEKTFGEDDSKEEAVPSEEANGKKPAWEEGSGRTRAQIPRN